MIPVTKYIGTLEAVDSEILGEYDAYCLYGRGFHKLLEILIIVAQKRRKVA